MPKTGRKPRKGDGFHRVVHAIEAVTSGRPHVRVEAPKRLKDKDTGRLREHDVVLTFTEHHHHLMVALECRERSRPVTVPEIEQFQKKCERTGVHRGIVVSATGFRKSALKKAEQLEIGCLTLSEVEAFDWCMVPGIHAIERNVTTLKIRLGLGENPPTDWKALLLDGTEVTNQIATSWAWHAFDRYVHDAISGEITRTFIEENPQLFALLPDGRRIRATRLTMIATYRVRTQYIPLEFKRYFDVAKSHLVANVAIAAVPVGAGKLANLILHETEEGIKVAVVEASNELAASLPESREE